MTAHDRKIKKGRKYDQAIEGARKIFLRDGFEGASVDEIAHEAGVSKATLYSYFPDKRSLFIEVATRECHRQAAEHMTRVDLTLPPEIILPEAARRLLEFMLSDMGLNIFRISVSESARFPELGLKFYESGPNLVCSALTVYFQAAISRGELMIDDLELAACQFAELCKAMVFPSRVMGQRSTVSQADIDRVVTGAVDMFMARYGANQNR